MKITQKLTRGLLSFGVFLLGMTGCNVTQQQQQNPPSLTEKEQVMVTEDNKTTETQEEPLPSLRETENIDTQISEKEEVEQKDTTEKKTPSFLGWGEANSQYWNKLQTVAQQATAFYAENGASMTLLSKGGKLYNSSTGSYVTVPYLCQSGGLDKTLLDFSCDILRISGEDINRYTSATTENSDVSIFTVMKNPSGNKYMIASAAGKIGSISEEEYKALLGQYNKNYGKARKLSPQMEEYERILNFIRVYEGNYDAYYVRDVIADEKYAVVTFSLQSEPNNVKQYILVNEDGFWEVALDNLQQKSNLTFAINQVLPDFSMALMPPYSVSFYKNDMKADFSDVLKQMVLYEQIEQQSQIRYKCGTTMYCYIVTYGEERYLGDKTSGEWVIKKVLTPQDAIDSMRLVNQNAPTFIVLDE